MVGQKSRDDAGEEASACLKLNLWRISALDPGSFNGRTEDFELPPIQVRILAREPTNRPITAQLFL